MSEFSPYSIIIAASSVVILSYLFNRLARKTNFPSVLLLIFLGIGSKLVLDAFHMLERVDLWPLLELLGIIGLIMIVLEAALDLHITKEKLGFIGKSFLIALLGLLLNTGIIAWIIKLVWLTDWYTGLLYAIPMAIMSSAIIIPSVANLMEKKREFMVYESTFSDILGIMLYYFVLEAGHSEGASGALAASISGNILLTIIISIVSSFLLIYLFQKIRTGTKFFLMIAVLILLYAIGKELHLSSLLIVLIFGASLSNPEIIRWGFLKKILDPEKIAKIFNDFHTVTVETSFVVRTFFFFIFGLSITLKSLIDSRVVLVSMMILSAIYLIRFVLTRTLTRGNHFPEWLMAPRGLITILLFYGIPADFQIEDFVKFQGILLFVILSSSLLMGYGLVTHGHSKSRREMVRSEDGVSPEAASHENPIE